MATESGKKRRLGKGLSGIIGETHTAGAHPSSQSQQKPYVSPPSSVSAQEPAGDPVVRLPLEQILPNRNQPRTGFDESALASLADSIRAVGVIQPVVVRPSDDGLYELIAGERRVKACKLAGLEWVPAIVRRCDDQRSAEAALIENLQREDLNPIERSEAIRGLMTGFGLSQKDVAERVGLDRSSVSNLLRLGELEGVIKEMLSAGLLGLGHGKALLSAEPGASRVRLAERAVREGWSVRRLESASRSGGPVEPGAAAARARGVSPDLAELERRIGEYLGTKVQLFSDARGRGSLTIRFYGLDHFDDVMGRIGYRGEMELDTRVG